MKTVAIEAMNRRSFVSGLVGVGNEKTARGKSGSSLVDASSPLKLFRVLDALFSGEGRVELRVGGSLGALAELEDVVAALRRGGAVGAAGALRTSAGTVVVCGSRLLAGGLAGRGVDEALGAPRGAGQAGVASGRAAARGPVLGVAARAGAAASAAGGTTVLGAVRGHDGAGVVVVAAVAVNLAGAETHGDTADTDMRLAGSVADDGGLAVANLAGDLVGGSQSSLGTARVAGDDLEVGTHLGGALLGDDAGVLVLGALAPDGGLLLAEEGDVAVGAGGGVVLVHGADGAARGGTAEVAGRGAVGGGRRLLEARGGAKGADGRGAAP